MNHQKAKNLRRQRRRFHVRKRIVGTVERPRLSVFRSSKHIYAQLIDDINGKTLASASSAVKRQKPVKGTVDVSQAKTKGEARKLKRAARGRETYGGNVAAAKAVGLKLAQVAKEHGIEKVAFDRGHYRYHGRVQALAEGAREGGLKF